MPYQTNPDTYPPSHEVPQDLSHKPVFAMPYEHFDGPCADHSQAIYLSIGTATYNQDTISAKVMRHVGSQWSPQSEELPVNRPIDLSILIAKVLFDRSNGQVEIRGGTYTGQHNQVVLTQEPRSAVEIDTFDTWLENNGAEIKERLNALCDVLNDLRRRNKI